MTDSLYDAARQCLDAETQDEKIVRTHTVAAAFACGDLSIASDVTLPEPIRMPGRPARPALVPARQLPQRGFGSNEGRAAFIHSIAHIEFNAIDLAWDAVYRFRDLPPEYYADWTAIANDEARHFVMLRERLQQLGYDYGDFDAHNGLWEMAEQTAHDGMTRMALVPRVLEARGLDVTPGMIIKLRKLGDDATADILEVILREEVAHVAAGSRWFRWYCKQRGLDSDATFAKLLTDYARGSLRGPFNDEARLAAGFSAVELAQLQALSP
ncbi:MAG: ferritin-like domain-containing protein [Pseudomonadota bacterium]|nr:ferritin-like domain-containing protein [Pseudomonadota bacterium]